MLSLATTPVHSATLGSQLYSPWPSDALSDFLRSAGKLVTYERDEAIYHEGDASHYLFRVQNGAVRICKFRIEGQRQIDAFYLPGDYFGFDMQQQCRFTAEATTTSTLLVADVASFLSPGLKAADFVSAVWKTALRDLHRSQDHSLLLGRNAHVRVLAFLHDIATRLKRTSTIELPMSRQDIADYLGLTIETVSRTLSDLVRDGAIDLPSSRSIAFRSPVKGVQ